MSERKYINIRRMLPRVIKEQQKGRIISVSHRPDLAHGKSRAGSSGQVKSHPRGPPGGEVIPAEILGELPTTQELQQLWAASQRDMFANIEEV